MTQSNEEQWHLPTQYRGGMSKKFNEVLRSWINYEMFAKMHRVIKFLKVV